MDQSVTFEKTSTVSIVGVNFYSFEIRHASKVMPSVQMVLLVIKAYSFWIHQYIKIALY